MEITIEYQPILEAPAASGAKLARRSLGEGGSFSEVGACRGVVVDEDGSFSEVGACRGVVIDEDGSIKNNKLCKTKPI